jgi:hypothetical protein
MKPKFNRLMIKLLLFELLLKLEFDTELLLLLNDDCESIDTKVAFCFLSISSTALGNVSVLLDADDLRNDDILSLLELFFKLSTLCRRRVVLVGGHLVSPMDILNSLFLMIGLLDENRGEREPESASGSFFFDLLMSVPKSDFSSVLITILFLGLSSGAFARVDQVELRDSRSSAWITHESSEVDLLAWLEAGLTRLGDDILDFNERELLRPSVVSDLLWFINDLIFCFLYNVTSASNSFTTVPILGRCAASQCQHHSISSRNFADGIYDTVGL